MVDEAGAARRAKLTKTLVEAVPAQGADYILWDTVLTGFGLRVRKSGRKTYVVSFRADGVKRQYTVGEHGPLTLEQARNLARDALHDVRKGGDPVAKRQADRTTLTLAQLLDQYLEHGPADRPAKRASSWNVDRYNFTSHVRPLLGTKRVDQLTKADLTTWQRQVVSGATAFTAPSGKKRGVTRVRGGPGAAARAMRSLAAALEWAVAVEMIPTNPTKHVRKIQDGRRERYLSDDEAGKLWQAVDLFVSEGRISLEEAAAFRLLMLTGARRSEILALQWSEVSPDGAALILPPARNKAGGGGRSRTIALPDRARTILRTLPRRGAYVLGGDGPMPVPRRAWARVAAAADLSSVTFHTLRHTLASFAVADGASLYAVGQVLGHTKPETSQRYAHLSTSAAAATAELAVLRYRSTATDARPEDAYASVQGVCEAVQALPDPAACADAMRFDPQIAAEAQAAADWLAAFAARLTNQESASVTPEVAL